MIFARHVLQCRNQLPSQGNGVGVAAGLRQLADLLQQLQGVNRLRPRDRRGKINVQHQSHDEPDNEASVAARHRRPILLSKARETSTDVALRRHHDVARLRASVSARTLWCTKENIRVALLWALKDPTQRAKMGGPTFVS